MKICITLDDVIRAKTKQICKIYKKYINKDIDLDSLDFSSNNYSEILNFDDIEDFNKFLYEDYAYEIFAEANTTERLIDKKLNLWLLKISDEDKYGKIDVFISNSKEFNLSIGYTCFFLSKIATRIREFNFPTDSTTLWDKSDVIITTDTNLINSKPLNKKVVKIEMDYNKECMADFSYKSLSDFLDDDKFFEKIKEKENND